MATRKEDDTGGDEEKRSSGFQLWFEEAWEGWLKSVSVIVLCALAYILYKFDLIAESRAGLICVVLIVGGAMVAAIGPAWPRVQSKSSALRALFILMVGLWAVSSGYPSVRAAMPPAPYAQAELTPQQLSAKLSTPSNGPYELIISGQLKPGAAEVEANYSLKAEGGGASDEVSGALTRTQQRVRVSRRGGTATQVVESNEKVERLPSVHGHDVTLTADSIDDQQLEGPLVVQLRAAAYDPIFCLVLGALVILIGLFFDVKLTEPKVKDKTWLGMAAAITYVFAIWFPITVTPHSLVRPAVGELVRALLIGGLGGWLLTIIARSLFGPKTPKKAPSKRS